MRIESKKAASPKPPASEAKPKAKPTLSTGQERLLRYFANRPAPREEPKLKRPSRKTRGPAKIAKKAPRRPAEIVDWPAEPKAVETPEVPKATEVPEANWHSVAESVTAEGAQYMYKRYANEPNDVPTQGSADAVITVTYDDASNSEAPKKPKRSVSFSNPEVTLLVHFQKAPSAHLQARVQDEDEALRDEV